MTIPADQANRYSAAGNGVTVDFAYQSKFLENADLVVLEVDNVTFVETVKTLNTHYTVTGAGLDAGGTVTFGVAPAAGKTIVVYGDPSVKQSTDLVNNDGFDADDVEKIGDRLTLIVRRLKDLLVRSLRQPDGDTADIGKLPAKATRASNYLAFNANGDPIAAAAPSSSVTSAFMATVLDDVDAATARATLDAQEDVVTTKGDIVVGGATGAAARKATGSDGYSLVPSSGAVDGLAWIRQAGFTLRGGYLDWTVAGSVLTVAIKTDDGGDPSDAEPVFIDFRDPTAATGSPVTRKIVAANSIAINDTALLGTVNSVAFRLWCVAFDDGGTIRLALINCVSTVAGAGSGRDVTAIYPLAGWGIASSTLEDNAADSAQVFYSAGAAVAAKAYATLGYATWEAGLAAAGTWSVGPTRKQLFGPGVALPGQMVQVQRTDTGALATGTTVIPVDDTIPQSTEGDQYMSQAITPSSASNILCVDVQAGQLCSNTAGVYSMTIALFQDAIANALKAYRQPQGSQNFPLMMRLSHAMLAAATAATTFKMRAGAGANTTTTFNGAAGAREFGGVCNSFIEVREIMG